MAIVGVSWGARDKNHKWVLLLPILGLLPYLIATIPSATDYPGHLARLHVLSLDGQADKLSENFIITWRWIGNLGVDLPALALTPLLGVELAMRAVAALIAPLTILGILMLSRAAHGRIGASAMLALPFAFSQPFLFGFLNFTLSAGLALITAAIWLGRDKQTSWSLSGFGLAAIAIWTAHIMGWVILIIMVAGSELASICRFRDAMQRGLRLAPLFLPIIPIFAWGSADGAFQFSYEDPILARKAMNFATVLRGVSKPFDLGMTALIGLAASLGLAWAGWRRLDPRLAIAGLLLTVAVLIGPTSAMHSWGPDLRLAPYAALVCILAIAPAKNPRQERLLFSLGLALFLLRTATISAQWAKSSGLNIARLAILDGLARHARLGFISAQSSCQSTWSLKSDDKLGAYGLVRYHAFSNITFQTQGSNILLLRHPNDRRDWASGSQDVPALCPQGQFDLAALKIKLIRMHRANFDHVWVAGIPSRLVPANTGYKIRRSRASDTLLTFDYSPRGKRAAP